MQDTLIRTLLRAALEETGAQRALLMLSRGDELRIVAEATRHHGMIVVRLRSEAATESILPKSVLAYVLQTRESVVFDNSAAQTTFAEDTDISQRKWSSILCLPLLSHAKVVGALCLENHLASRVFTPAQVRVLKLVASLAASALEDSRLYSELREREAKIRCLVDANIIGISTVDIGGPILEANGAYLRMLGYERNDLVLGRLNWTELTPPEWRSADAQRVKRVKRVGHLQPFEKEFFRKDGTRVPVLLGVARFKEPRNQAIVFALDMSKRKRTDATALQSRTIEQTRTAQKLHDALLQNFQGMIFQFQAARNLMPRHPDDALRSLNEAIHEGEQALDQSRNAMRDLRPKPFAKRTLRND